MGMLTDGKVDASCSDLTMTTPRVRVVDFIEPVWADRCVYKNTYHRFREEVTCYLYGEYYPYLALW
jgi:hypothetical protein